jgi:excisionase family DNA binding protein
MSVSSRIGPDELTAREIAALKTALRDGDPMHLVGSHGASATLPEPVLGLLRRLVDGVGKGTPMALVSEDDVITTQAAARHLGVSRPFLIGLLEKGEIPYFLAGRHRKLRLSDVRQYAKRRDEERRRTLNALTSAVQQAGLYEGEVVE